MRISDWSSDVCSSDLASVEDDGVGLPHGFELADATGLGLSIVRTLVQSELVGQIAMRRGPGLYPRPGTRVDLEVPEIGRASCRERGSQYGSISVVDVSLQKQETLLTKLTQHHN